MSRSLSILLLENIHPVAKQLFETEGFQVEALKSALSADELSLKLKSYQALGVRSKTEIPTQVLTQSPHLLAIGCYCIGTNHVDLRSAKLSGVPVFNAPHSNTRSVAELVMAEVVCLARQIMDRSQKAHKGEWIKSAEGSHEVRGKTLGIVGYGHIGTQVSVLAESFGMRVLFYDVTKKLPIGNAQATGSLKELLAASDFVTLHVPSTTQTKKLIGDKELKKMKPGAYLLNLSRGDVVDLPALATHIASGHIGGAGVDVFPVEPASNSEKFISELQGLGNVILTPHIGGSTEEAQYAIGIEVATAMIQFLKYGTTVGAVNFPAVQLGLRGEQKVTRISNIHRNQPGALANINQQIGSVGGNIVGQALVTDGDIGYAVIDIEGDNLGELDKKIQNQSNISIRTRQLGPF